MGGVEDENWDSNPASRLSPGWQPARGSLSSIDSNFATALGYVIIRCLSYKSRYCTLGYDNYIIIARWKTTTNQLQFTQLRQHCETIFLQPVAQASGSRRTWRKHSPSGTNRWIPKTPSSTTHSNWSNCKAAQDINKSMLKGLEQTSSLS